MARLVGPDEGSRLAYGIRADNTLSTGGGMTATVYADAAGTVLADILTYPGGAAVAGSVLTVGVSSLLPLFQWPDAADVVYVSVNGGPVSPVYARTDDRLDAVKATADAAETPAGAQAKVAAAEATAASTYGVARAALRGNRVVFLGDSITIAQANDTPNRAWGHSFPSYASYLSKGRLLRVRNAGVAGNRAADMLARFDTDVTPYAPSIVVITAGTNDWNDSGPTPLATYQANVQALVAKCRRIGAQPVLGTVPPNVLSSARRQRTIIGNSWLRRYCAGEGIPLVDFYNLLTDPATGDYLTAHGSSSNDKTHPLNAGYAAMGALVNTTLSTMLPPVDALLPAENADPNNLLTNGLNLTTTGSGSTLMPTGWTVQTSHPAGVTGSLVTGDTTIKGNWWKVTADGTAAVTNNEFVIVSGAVPGHTYAYVGRFKATGLRGADSGSGSRFLIGLAFNSVLLSDPYDFRVASTLDYDVAEGTWYQECLAPSDASTILVRRQLLNVTAGAGTLQVAQMGLYDLTAMGLV